MNFFFKIKENPLLSFLIFLLIVAFVAFVGVLFFDCVKNCVSGLVGLTAKNKILTFLGIGMGGILVALQALASHRRAKAMEDTAEHTEKGLRQERLKNAIEHLGHEKDSVRLGGAYELFHLAEDNPELRKTALDILCAHIRQTTGEKEYQEKHESKPSEEVQSLLTLLFVKNYKVFTSCDINLWGCWLNGADLGKAHLRRAILNGAYLQGATLTEAHLQEAELVQAHLQGTSLRLAHLQGAFLMEARMQEVKLSKAYLQGAYIWGTYLQGANLYGAHLQGAYIWKTYLQGANLYGAHLQGADLSEVRLQGANLGEARLQGAKLSEVHLQGANILGAHLQGVVGAWHLPEDLLSKLQLEGANPWRNLRKQPPSRFANRLRESIGEESDLSGVTFAGGLSREDADSLVEDLSDEKANELREKLEPHIDQRESSELPEERGAITKPPYTKEEAEQWIAEYEKATKVTEEDS